MLHASMVFSHSANVKSRCWNMATIITHYTISKISQTADI